MAPTTEIVCLQEVALGEFAYFAAALGPQFEGAMAFNDPDFWANWVVPEIPWQPNGPAIFVRTDAFDDITISDRPLGTGNHAAVAEADTHRDWADDSGMVDPPRQRQGVESRVGIQHGPGGDARRRIDDRRRMWGFQRGFGARRRRCRVRQAGFVDAHASVGQRRATHPWSSQYYSSTRWAIIDHVVVRKGQPVAATVVDSGLAGITDELTRIEATLRQNGSDHYTVTATIAVN